MQVALRETLPFQPRSSRRLIAGRHGRLTAAPPHHCASLCKQPLRDDQKAKVIKAVTGESNDFSLRDGATGQNSNITHLPHRFFNESRGLTKLNLCECSSLSALPESLGQLQALTTLDLYDESERFDY